MRDKIEKSLYIDKQDATCKTANRDLQSCEVHCKREVFIFNMHTTVLGPSFVALCFGTCKEGEGGNYGL
jgi:hypothetical protein